VYLADKGDQLVENLTTAHLAELYSLAGALNDLLQMTRQKMDDLAEE